MLTIHSNIQHINTNMIFNIRQLYNTHYSSLLLTLMTNFIGAIAINTAVQPHSPKTSEEA